MPLNLKTKFIVRIVIPTKLNDIPCSDGMRQDM